MTELDQNSQTSSEEDEVIDSVNPTRWPIAWFVILLLALTFAAMRFNGTFEPAEPPSAAPEREFPHFYLSEVNVKQYSDQGALRYEMNSPEINHFGQLSDDNGQSVFTTPVFTFKDRPDATQWTVTAKQGLREQKGLWFSLQGDVKAVKPSDAQGNFELNTEELRLNTRDEYAETHKAVTMRNLKDNKKSETQAIGARADLKNDVVDLVSDVKGYHEP